MKKKIIVLLGAFIGLSMFLLQSNYSKAQTGTIDDDKVVCHCSYWWLWDNQCTAAGDSDNATCAYDDCDPHDSNCDY